MITKMKQDEAETVLPEKFTSLEFPQEHCAAKSRSKFPIMQKASLGTTLNNFRQTQ